MMAFISLDTQGPFTKIEKWHMAVRSFAFLPYANFFIAA